MSVFVVWVLLALVDIAVQASEPREVCYGELGCFSDDEAFHDSRYRPWNLLPQSREDVNTRFLLYTGRNPSGAGTLSWNSTEDDVRRFQFIPSSDTKVLIFGFSNRLQADNWVMKMKDAYLKVRDYNVIIVDWHGGNGMPYSRAVANTRLVGAEVALLLSRLQRAFGADPMKVHVVGHSLGAHVSGYAGERVKTLGRITGLDPAEPFFQGMPPKVRLDPTDADFVDVIHTDGGAFLRNIWLNQGMGMEQPSGHVDFYPNGGSSMPGCDMLSRVVHFFKGLAEAFMYRITATFGSFLSENVTGRGRLYLRLQGQRGTAVIPVNRRTTEFLSGTTYSFVVHTLEDVGSIRQVGLRMGGFPFPYTGKLPLSSLTVTPMTEPHLESDVSNSTLYMCPPSNETDALEEFMTMRSCS